MSGSDPASGLLARLKVGHRPGPLQGVIVLDLTRALAGPYATLMLADAGAAVIKVERPLVGDDSRAWGPPFVGPESAQESTYFLSVNRNKLSVELDLRSGEGRRRLEELIRRADVLVENFRPEAREKLGLSDDALAALNPSLITLSITGFGHGGPDGHRPGYDQILQGEAGLMSVTGQPDGPSTKVGIPICDILAGMFGAFGVVAALRERQRSGAGQVVRTSLLEAVLAVHTYQATRWLLAGEIPDQEGNQHPTISPYGSYACADGIVNIAVGSDKLWQVFAPLVGVDPGDGRFRSNALRRANRIELDQAIEKAFRQEPVSYWVARLDEAGVPAGRVRNFREVYDWAQVDALQLLESMVHPVLGQIQLPASPLTYSRSVPGTSSPPPLLGEHSESLFAWLEELQDS
ncbi:MAG: CaiB/BaiF CoA transferase family protein [Acidimicrobiales bacterium]